MQFFNFGVAFIVLSVIPFLFLVYTVLNLDSLGITLKHPRVIVELSIFLIMLIFGIMWITV